MSFSTPPFPKSVRLAHISDIQRLGIIATASLFYSSWFHHKRPFYKEYTSDAVTSYAESFRKAILNPQLIVLVVDDTLEGDEFKQVFPELKAMLQAMKIPLDATPENTTAHQVIVSAAILSLTAHSAFHGVFQPKDQHADNSSPKLQDRDSSEQAGHIFNETLHPREVA